MFESSSFLTSKGVKQTLKGFGSTMERLISSKFQEELDPSGKVMENSVKIFFRRTKEASKA